MPNNINSMYILSWSLSIVQNHGTYLLCCCRRCYIDYITIIKCPNYGAIRSIQCITLSWFASANFKSCPVAMTNCCELGNELDEDIIIVRLEAYGELPHYVYGSCTHTVLLWIRWDWIYRWQRGEEDGWYVIRDRCGPSSPLQLGCWMCGA